MSLMVPAAPSKRRSLADVLTSSLSAVSGRPNEFDLRRSERMVVVLVDGLGSASLRARSGHARTLSERLNKATTITSGFPTTTAVALASLTTGLLPGEHGMVGYRVLDARNDRVVNQLSGWDDMMTPEIWQPHPTVFDHAAAEGVRPTVVGPNRYVDSGLTRAILRGADYQPASSIQSRFATTRKLFDEGGRQLVYLYVPELDMAAHAHGWNSDRWVSELERLDSAVGEFAAQLGRTEGMLVTADHGMVDVAEHEQLVFDDGALTDGVRFVAGDPRCLQLHVEPDATAQTLERLVDAWRESESSRAWVATRDEMVASGWFGTVTSEARSRMGDVFVAARKNVAYYDGRDATGYGRGMIGQHGSFSPEETHVPLIGFGTAAR